MHVVVPTLDLVTVLSKLRPMRSLVTAGFQFPVYTIEAYNGKLRLIVGDKTTITASTEIFATVKQEGKISVNGADFYETIVKFTPDSKSTVAGSKEIVLKGDDKELNVTTVTYYNKLDTKITQKRSFSRLTQDLKVADFSRPASNEVTIKAQHLPEIFKVAYRLISSYTSDMVGLSGILLRIRDHKLLSVVSDGTRLLEVKYPHDVQAEDFDVILPKLTTSLLQVLIHEGDEVQMKVDTKSVRFLIDSSGLQTIISSHKVKATFPEYMFMFDTTGSQFSINAKMFSDNIMNIRRSLNDDTFRVIMSFDGTKLLLKNTKSSTHLKFVNDGLPVTSPQGQPFEILINAFLLEGLLGLLNSEDITIICPPNNKPMVLLNQDENLRIRTAIALARE